MQAAKRRFTKNLWSERSSNQKPLLVTCADELEQSTFVVDRILELREEGIPLTRQAVLFRASHNSDALEIELSRRNVPFVKWGGLKFLEAPHIKDLLAFLRILENPRDDLSWMRVLQLLEGIGPGRARQAVNFLQEAEDDPLALLRWKAPTVARGQINELARLIYELSGADLEVSLAAQIDRIRHFYNPLFEKKYDQPEMRLRDLDQLELLAQQAGSRATFLADLTLDPPTFTGDLAGTPFLDEEYVVLSTIHSAKGCEWDAVSVIHAADGVIPSDMSNDEEDLEEERRLLYVAMTRARDRLFITFPLRYYHRKHPLGDSHSYAQLSRFLPPELFPLFERMGHDRSEPKSDSELGTPIPITDSVHTRLPAFAGISSRKRWSSSTLLWLIPPCAILPKPMTISIRRWPSLGWSAIGNMRRIFSGNWASSMPKQFSVIRQSFNCKRHCISTNNWETRSWIGWRICYRITNQGRPARPLMISVWPRLGRYPFSAIR
jgi:DNA helicase-2/ATP-dependent DNA helicase PcrA